MVAPVVIRQERKENLQAFEAAIQQLPGVQEETLDALFSVYRVVENPPKETDFLAVARYNAAALRAIGEALVALSEAQNPTP
jgi:hypothetical protein